MSEEALPGAEPVDTPITLADNTTSPETRPIAIPTVLYVLTAVLALAGDLLLRELPWGINIALWGTALYWVAVPLAIGMTLGPVPRSSLVFLLAAGAFMLAPAIRDAPSTHAISYAAALLCLFYGVATLHGFAWFSAGVLEYPFRAIHGYLIMLICGWRAAVQVSSAPGPGYRAQVWTGARGVLLAVPFLAVFGFLFARADVQFRKFFDLELDPEVMGTHVAAIVGCAAFAWLALSAVARRQEQVSPAKPVFDSEPLRMGAGEVSIAVGMIAGMFLLFVGLQIRYLFGGAEYLLGTENLTAAEYAKSGFYELVCAGTIAIGSIYFFDCLTQDSAASARQKLHWIVRVLLALVAVVLCSAAHRMLVYIQMFGLTEQRLATLVFMTVLAAMLLWSEFTIVRNRRERFAGGALLALLAAAASFIVANPHALIAEINCQRAREGKHFDLEYAKSLSADALPAMSRLLNDTTDPKLTGLRDLVGSKYSQLLTRDWRTRNLGQVRAFRVGLSRNYD